ncbi:GAF domain-containing protein [Knoellia sp. p5-6-4]|uniref:helix-turn-helix domain-containing protein n=1 Tax=unclassified Knoellia TaxID=2618719 RepID=UPI0023DC69B1|nr:helix-turn-helix domain-containing protein [Knoellia sp. p5-6-4]MDF2143574.1 helix-turn-helix domain-containing protein [Knoellia sp. p5-6-4]
METDEPAALRLLRLLAEGAPVAELSTVDDSDGEARELALRVRAALESRRRREAELTALVDTARDLAALRDPSGVLDAIVRRARTLLGTDVAYLTLYDPEAGDTFMRATDGSVSAEFQVVRLSFGDGLGGLVAKSRKPYWTADYFHDDRFQHTGQIDSAVGDEGLVSICGTPLLAEGEFLGVLFAANRSTRPFSPDQVALLASLAALAAVSIVQTRAAAETADALAQLSAAHDLVRHHTAGIERAAAAHDRFAALVLEGGGVEDITAALAELLGGWVVLLGDEGELLSQSDGSSQEDPDLAALQANPAVRDTTRTGRLAHDGTTWAIGVQAAHSQMGVLVLGGVAHLDESDQRTLERAAVVSALVLLFERAAADAEQRVRTDLVSDLITGRGDTSALQARARASGVDPTRPHVVLVATAGDDVPRRTLLMSAHAAAGPGSIAGEHDGRVVALVPSEDPQGAAAELARRLRRLGSITVGGAGPVRAPEDVPASWAEAARTSAALCALGMGGTGASAAHLGFAGLVVGNDPDVDGYVRRHLGPLLDYDERRGAELVKTLAAYFDAGTSPRHAATALHVHVNTVSQRLDRISALLGAQWQHPRQSLELQLALRLRHLMTSS